MNVLSEPIWIPAPSVRASVVAVDAIPTTWSAKVIVSESTTKFVPSTYKSPLILTLPLDVGIVPKSNVVVAILTLVVVVPIPTSPVPMEVTVVPEGTYWFWTTNPWVIPVVSIPVIISVLIPIVPSVEIPEKTNTPSTPVGDGSRTIFSGPKIVPVVPLPEIYASP